MPEPNLDERIATITRALVSWPEPTTPCPSDELSRHYHRAFRADPEAVQTSAILRAVGAHVSQCQPCYSRLLDVLAVGPIALTAPTARVRDWSPLDVLARYWNQAVDEVASAWQVIGQAQVPEFTAQRALSAAPRGADESVSEGTIEFEGSSVSWQLLRRGEQVLMKATTSSEELTRSQTRVLLVAGREHQEVVESVTLRWAERDAGTFEADEYLGRLGDLGAGTEATLVLVHELVPEKVATGEEARRTRVLELARGFVERRMREQSSRLDTLWATLKDIRLETLAARTEFGTEAAGLGYSDSDPLMPVISVVSWLVKQPSPAAVGERDIEAEAQRRGCSQAVSRALAIHLSKALSQEQSED